MSNPVLFREVQRWRDVWWVMAAVLGLAAFQWWGFLRQIGRGRLVGAGPTADWLLVLFWLFFGIGLPYFFIRLRLVIEVAPGGVTILYRPFVNRRIAAEQIAGVEPRVYHPPGEFGSWGIRGWGRHVAYNVSGHAGVELTLVDGRHVLIGSQRPAELAGAIYKIWRD
jgi:hypothetical protein